MGPGALDYFEMKIGRHMGPEPFDERSELFLRSRMREDMDKADYANSLMAEIGKAVLKFLDIKDGNIEDAYEILASRISERAFVKIAKEKYGLSGNPLE